MNIFITIISFHFLNNLLDEVTLVNEMIQGILDLIAWEKELEANTAS